MKDRTGGIKKMRKTKMMNNHFHTKNLEGKKFLVKNPGTP